MKSILIRAIEEGTLAALKRRARYNRRSLQGELLSILDRAARQAPPAGSEEELPWITVETGRSTGWSRDEMYDDRGR